MSRGWRARAVFLPSRSVWAGGMILLRMSPRSNLGQLDRMILLLIFPGCICCWWRIMRLTVVSSRPCLLPWGLRLTRRSTASLEWIRWPSIAMMPCWWICRCRCWMVIMPLLRFAPLKRGICPLLPSPPMPLSMIGNVVCRQGQMIMSASPWVGNRLSRYWPVFLWQQPGVILSLHQGIRRFRARCQTLGLIMIFLIGLMPWPA